MTQTHTVSSTSLIREAGFPYFAIALVARLPFAMMIVGVLTVVVAARGSFELGGLASAAVGIGTACVGPFLGAAVDRFGQRAALSIAAVANGTMLAVFALVVYADTPDALVLAAGVCIGATAPQVAPMSRARLVTLISDRLPAEVRAKTVSGTMSYESAADEVVFVFGPVVVGLLASQIAPWAPLVIAAVLTVVFVGAFALHPTGRLVSAERRSGGAAPSAVGELFRPGVLIIVLGISGVGLFFGGMLTALTSFMDDRGTTEQAGLLYGVMGIGSAVLALAVAWLPARFRLGHRWMLFAAILFTGTLALFWVKTPGEMMVALAIMGIGIGPTLVTLYSLGAEHSPRGRSATVMTMLGSGVIVGQALAAAVTGSLAEKFGTSTALIVPVVAGGIVVIASLIALFLHRTRG